MQVHRGRLLEPGGGVAGCRGSAAVSAAVVGSGVCVVVAERGAQRTRAVGRRQCPQCVCAEGRQGRAGRCRWRGIERALCVFAAASGEDAVGQAESARGRGRRWHAGIRGAWLVQFAAVCLPPPLLCSWFAERVWVWVWWQMHKQQPYSIIFMDCNMPVCDGESCWRVCGLLVGVGLTCAAVLCRVREHAADSCVGAVEWLQQGGADRGDHRQRLLRATRGL